jgi:hypothetical protein
MNADARIAFLNLAADAARAGSAGSAGDLDRYEQSLARARKTLLVLKDCGGAAYAEGELLLEGLELAREDGAWERIRSEIDAVAIAA